MTDLELGARFLFKDLQSLILSSFKRKDSHKLVCRFFRLLQNGSNSLTNIVGVCSRPALVAGVDGFSSLRSCVDSEYILSLNALFSNSLVHCSHLWNNFMDDYGLTQSKKKPHATPVQLNHLFFAATSSKYSFSLTLLTTIQPISFSSVRRLSTPNSDGRNRWTLAATAASTIVFWSSSAAGEIAETKASWPCRTCWTASLEVMSTLFTSTPSTKVAWDSSRVIAVTSKLEFKRALMMEGPMFPEP